MTHLSQACQGAVCNPSQGAHVQGGLGIPAIAAIVVAVLLAGGLAVGLGVGLTRDDDEGSSPATAAGTSHFEFRP